jgi:hypothetical protein
MSSKAEIRQPITGIANWMQTFTNSPADEMIIPIYGLYLGNFAVAILNLDETIVAWRFRIKIRL